MNNKPIILIKPLEQQIREEVFKLKLENVRGVPTVMLTPAQYDLLRYECRRFIRELSDETQNTIYGCNIEIVDRW